jgi:hypothetical protein
MSGSSRHGVSNLNEHSQIPNLTILWKMWFTCLILQPELPGFDFEVGGLSYYSCAPDSSKTDRLGGQYNVHLQRAAQPNAFSKIS